MESPKHLTYAALCGDPASCPLGTGAPLAAAIERIYTYWRTDVAAVRSADDLLGDVLLNNGPRMTGGIAVMVDDPRNPGGVLQILHGASRSAVATFYLRTFAYLGEVIGGDIETVELNPDLLRATAETRVVSDPARQIELLTAPGAELELVATHAAAAAGTDMIKTRMSMYIPYPLIPHVIDLDLTAKEALTTLEPVIADLGLEAACQPLLQWLIVATTKVAGGEGAEPNTLIRQTTAGVTPQRLRAVHAERNEDVLYRQLPALKPTGGPKTDPAVLGILQATREQRNAVTADLDDRRAERERLADPKSVQDRWPDYVERVCGLCHTEDHVDLPKYWQRAAAWKKGGGTTLKNILQDEVDKAAHHFNVDGPRVTVRQANDLQTWTFVGPTHYSLASGLGPFTVTPPGAVSLEAVLRLEADFEHSLDHATIMEGNASLKASDAKLLRCGNAYVPLVYDEMELALEAFLAVLGAVLGCGHPLVSSYQRALRAYKRVRIRIKHVLDLHLGKHLGAATIMYYFHSEIRYWLAEQWSLQADGHVPVPNIASAFQTFDKGDNLQWLPQTSLVPQLQVLARQAPTPPPFSGPAPTPSVPTGGGGRRTPGTQDERSREGVRNRNRDDRYVGETALASKIQRKRIEEAIDQGGAPPNTPQGGPRCISWHVKGSCFSNCNRRSDHIKLKEDDKEILYTWVKKAFTTE